MKIPLPDAGRPLVLRTMEGIGDLCWVFAMISNLKKTLNIPTITIKMERIGSFRDDRALRWARRFSFLDCVWSEPFCVKVGYTADCRVQYIKSGYDDEHREFTLVPNAAIEWDTRLEDIWPMVPIDWQFFRHYRRLPGDDRVKDELRSEGDYICLHLCHGDDNMNDGQNIGGAWSLDNWRKLIVMLRGLLPGIRFAILGSVQDGDYAGELLREWQCDDIRNLCGRTSVPQAMEVIRHAKAMIGFPSGIPIAAVYLGIPTVCFWNPEGRSVSSEPAYRHWFGSKFATNWVPPGAAYHPAVYTRDTPKSVFDAVRSLLETNNNH